MGGKAAGACGKTLTPTPTVQPGHAFLLAKFKASMQKKGDAASDSESDCDSDEGEQEEEDEDEDEGEEDEGEEEVPSTGPTCQFCQHVGKFQRITGTDGALCVNCDTCVRCLTCGMRRIKQKGEDCCDRCL